MARRSDEMDQKRRIRPDFTKGGKKKTGKGVGSGGSGMDARASLPVTIEKLLDSLPIPARLEVLRTFCFECGEKYCKHRR